MAAISSGRDDKSPPISAVLKAARPKKRVALSPAETGGALFKS